MQIGLAIWHLDALTSSKDSATIFSTCFGPQHSNFTSQRENKIEPRSSLLKCLIDDLDMLLNAMFFPKSTQLDIIDRIGRNEQKKLISHSQEQSKNRRLAFNFFGIRCICCVPNTDFY